MIVGIPARWACVLYVIAEIDASRRCSRERRGLVLGAHWRYRGDFAGRHRRRAMADGTLLPESIAFRRRDELPGAPSSAARLDPAAHATVRIPGVSSREPRRNRSDHSRQGNGVEPLLSLAGVHAVLRVATARVLAVGSRRAGETALGKGDAAWVVAAECGFVDQSHLTRHFRRFLGVTPMAYAKASAFWKTTKTPRWDRADG